MLLFKAGTSLQDGVEPSVCHTLTCQVNIPAQTCPPALPCASSSVSRCSRYSSFLVLLVYGYFLQLALQAYIQSLSLTACVFLTCPLQQRHHAVAKGIHVETSTWSKTVFRTRASLHLTHTERSSTDCMRLHVPCPDRIAMLSALQACKFLLCLLLVPILCMLPANTVQRQRSHSESERALFGARLLSYRIQKCAVSFYSGDSMETWMVSVCLSERRKGQSQKVSTAELPFCHPSVRLTLGFFSLCCSRPFSLCRFFSSVSPSPPLPPALLSPTTKKGENRRPVKRRSGL